jgi:hypothetical protein
MPRVVLVIVVEIVLRVGARPVEGPGAVGSVSPGAVGSKVCRARLACANVGGKGGVVIKSFRSNSITLPSDSSTCSPSSLPSFGLTAILGLTTIFIHTDDDDQALPWCPLSSFIFE